MRYTFGVICPAGRKDIDILPHTGAGSTQTVFAAQTQNPFPETRNRVSGKGFDLVQAIPRLRYQPSADAPQNPARRLFFIRSPVLLLADSMPFTVIAKSRQGAVGHKPFRDQGAQLAPRQPLPAADMAGFRHRTVQLLDPLFPFAGIILIMRTGLAQGIPVHDNVDHLSFPAVQTPMNGRHVAGKLFIVASPFKMHAAQGMMRTQTNNRLFHNCQRAILSCNGSMGLLKNM